MSEPKKATGTRRKGSSYEMTDMGNGERFIAEHGDKFLHHTGLGWLRWTGKVWEPDEGAKGALRAAKSTTKRMKREAADSTDPDYAKRLFVHANRTQAVPKQKAMLEAASSDLKVTVEKLDELDANPSLLPCSNGTVDLETGKLRESSPKDRMTRLADVTYNPNAKAERWHQFLSEIFPGDPDLIAYLQRAYGYSLTGETREQVLFILEGAKENGKSTFMYIAMKIAGEYGRVSMEETFAPQSKWSAGSNAVNADLAGMRGARIVSVPETADGAKLAISLVKRITGEESAITVRYLGKNPFEYEPRFKLWLQTNNLPVIPHESVAMWRRVRVIPFREHFIDPAADSETTGVTDPHLHLADKNLRRDLRRELPGILAWAVEGARLWYRDGLGSCDAVIGAGREYREEMDHVDAWLHSGLIVQDPSAKEKAGALWLSFAQWCQATGRAEGTQTTFGRTLSQRGFPAEKQSDGGRLRLGLHLRIR